MNIETLILGVFFLLGGVGLGVALTVLMHRQAVLAGQADDLQKRVGELERCTARRLPHRTAAGVEDALAVTLDLLRYADEVELEASAIRQRAGQQAEILRLVRQGPEAYDPERPAGERKKRFNHGGTESTEGLRDEK